MRRVIPLVLIVVLCLAFAPAPFPKAARPDTMSADVRALQGTWRRCRFSTGILHIKEAETTVTVRGDRMRFSAGGRRTAEWAFTLDTHARPPRIDWHAVGGDERLLGIYRIERDTLTIHSDDAAFPKDFDAEKDGAIVEVFRRK